MHSHPRKTIALIALVLAMTVAGFAPTPASSTTPQDKTPEYDSVPFSDKDYKILPEERQEFFDDLVWAKADYVSMLATPADELGLTEDDKMTVLLKYKTFIVEAHYMLTED